MRTKYYISNEADNPKFLWFSNENGLMFCDSTESHSPPDPGLTTESGLTTEYFDQDEESRRITKREAKRLFPNSWHFTHQSAPILNTEKAPSSQL